MTYKEVVAGLLILTGVVMFGVGVSMGDTYVKDMAYCSGTERVVEDPTDCGSEDYYLVEERVDNPYKSGFMVGGLIAVVFGLVVGASRKTTDDEPSASETIDSD